MTLDHLSYSKISLFSKSRGNFIKRYIKGERDPMGDLPAFGILVDMLLFGDDYTDRFEVAEIPKLSGHSKKLADKAVELKVEPTIENLTEIANDDTDKLWKSVKKDDRNNNIANLDIIKYVELSNTDKHLISQDVLDNAYARVEILKLDERTQDIFNDVNGTPHLRLSAPFGKYEIIGELDWVIINEKTKTIKPYDLKTGGQSGDAFQSTFVTNGYYIQYAVYEEMLLHNYPGYEILPLEFVYLGNFDKRPTIAKLSYDLIKVVREGGEYKFEDWSNPSKFKSWKEVGNDIIWHYETNYWDSSKKLYEANGIITM